MLSLAQARSIVDEALASARDQSFPPMTVAVLDAGGHLLSFAREDRSSLLRERIARGKALGALNMGVGSRALSARAESHPHFVSALVALAGGDLVPVPGGVLVRDPSSREILGALGVTGHLSDNDEACAVHAIEAVGLLADPGS